ncbi:MAG: discoidin domain-containing protein [Verrucomicrobium sp.]|nr:discoidin domain-containing protein [Verrucomicrobium sp.]
MLQEKAASLEEQISALPQLPAPQAHEHAGFHSGWAADADSVRWVQVDLGRELPLDSVVIIPAFLGGTTAYGFPARFRVDASNDPGFGESTALLDHTASDFRPAMAPVGIACDRLKARYVRFTATRLASGKAPRMYFCLGELLVFSDHAAVSARCEVTATRAVETAPTWSPRNLVDGVSALGLPVVPAARPTNGWHSAIQKDANHERWVQVDLGSEQPLEEVRFIPTHPADFPDRAGFGFPVWFRLEAANEENFLNPSIIYDASVVPFPNPGDNPVPFLARGIKARYVRMLATQLWERSNDFVISLSEMEVYAKGHNIAAGKKVTAYDDVLAPLWQREWLVDGMAASGRLMDWEQWLQKLSRRRELLDAKSDVQGELTIAGMVARKHALWWGMAFGVALLLLAVISWMRALRSRKLEIEALRQRIARDLHDEVGSHLGSISLASELALRESPEDARATLDEIHRMARQAAESMRGIVWLVREGGEPTLERLVQALRESATTQLQGLAWELAVPDQPPRISASLDFHRHVFLFFKEAVNNVVRHARATAVHLAVEWSNERFQLSIRDDGRGFDAAAGSGGGSGLANMRHRAAALRGEMNVSSTASSSGTIITLTAPLH